MKIYTDTDDKTYFFNVVKFISNFEKYSEIHEKNKSEMDFEIADILSKEETIKDETVKCYRLLGTQKFINPSKISFIKIFGEYLLHDPYAFLVLNCTNEDLINYEKYSDFKKQTFQYIYRNLCSILSMLDMTNYYNDIRYTYKKEGNVREKKVSIDNDIKKMVRKVEYEIKSLLYDDPDNYYFYFGILNDIREIVQTHSYPWPSFKKWANANHNLYWYHPVFYILENKEAFEKAMNNGMLDYNPTDEDIKARNEYITKMNKEKELSNSNDEIYYYLQSELIDAMRILINTHLNSNN